MSEEFDALLSEVLSDLKSSGEEFWDQLSEDQVGIVKQAAKDLARTTLLLVKEPDRADIHRETILILKSTLANEANLAALQAAARLKDAIQKALGKLVMVGLSALA